MSADGSRSKALLSELSPDTRSSNSRVPVLTCSLIFFLRSRFGFSLAWHLCFNFSTFFLQCLESFRILFFVRFCLWFLSFFFYSCTFVWVLICYGSTWQYHIMSTRVITRTCWIMKMDLTLQFISTLVRWTSLDGHQHFLNKLKLYLLLLLLYRKYENFVCLSGTQVHLFKMKRLGIKRIFYKQIKSNCQKSMVLIS